MVRNFFYVVLLIFSLQLLWINVTVIQALNEAFRINLRASSKIVVAWSGQSLNALEANKRKPNVYVDERSTPAPLAAECSVCENQFCLLSEAEEREQKSNGFTQHDIITIPIVWLKTQTAFLGQASSTLWMANHKIDLS